MVRCFLCFQAVHDEPVPIRQFEHRALILFDSWTDRLFLRLMVRSDRREPVCQVGPPRRERKLGLQIQIAHQLRRPTDLSDQLIILCLQLSIPVFLDLKLQWHGFFMVDQLARVLHLLLT